jgi:deazaflavin-dependent oxidoreductase (nitroreductase family)
MNIEKLASRRTIDLTTFGRRSGLARRIEIWWFHVDGRFVVTGTPGRRDWLANVIANPSVIVHVDGMNIEARARVVSDADFRRRVFTQPDTRWYSTQAQLDRLVATAPMIVLDLAGFAEGGAAEASPSP